MSLSHTTPFGRGNPDSNKFEISLYTSDHTKTFFSRFDLRTNFSGYFQQSIRRKKLGSFFSNLHSERKKVFLSRSKAELKKKMQKKEEALFFTLREILGY
jgi:hypothetical protein